MRRTISCLPVAAMLLASFGCGGAKTPPPQAQPPVKPTGAVAPPQPIYGQITVMGKNGPQTVTVMQTDNRGTEKISRRPAEKNSRLPLKTPPSGVLKTLPSSKEQ